MYRQLLPHDWHFHRCPECSHVWGHDASHGGDHDAHTCAACGHRSYECYCKLRIGQLTDAEVEQLIARAA